MWFIYFLLCVFLPMCIPIPEAAVILWGTERIGSAGAFILGVSGSVLGLALMYTVSSMIADRFFKGKREKRQLAWLRKLTGRYRNWILGVLLIVPVVSDEVLCAGSALLNIPLSQLLKIGTIAKTVSVGMIAFSGSIGARCGLEYWKILVAELLLMLFISVGLQQICRQEETECHERIHIDC